MKEITKDELEKILKDHKDWLADKTKGKRADLHNADLSNADLSNADLSNANLRYADLRYADLRYADLRYADLHLSNLSYADLRYANLSYANLLIFQYQQHIAYCTGERLTIGCFDKSLLEWSGEYEEIGKKYNYTDLQIKMYGNFISMCIEHAATIKDKDK